MIGPNSVGGKETFQVIVCENLTKAQGYLTYSIDRNLKLLSVSPSDSLLQTYREASLENARIREFDEEDLEDLRRNYSVVWRDR